MGSWVAKCCCAVVMVTGAVVSGFASPATFKLLPLVPAGSEVVAGFENRHDPITSGRLLLTTHSNRLDLDDWLALAGVDSQRIYDEIVEVAAAGSEGELTEHVLLVAGHFDGERIYRSLEQNGAKATHAEGLKIMLVEPLPREQGDMLETRWLLILNNQIAMFGTQALVRRTLKLYFDHAVPDPVLLERLSQFRPDITSWNVLASSPIAARNMSFAKSHSAWARLMEDSELLMVGARFGPKIRVDLLLTAASNRRDDYFNEKTALFIDVFAQNSSTEGSISQSFEPRVSNLQISGDQIHGSVVLPRKRFDDWREEQRARNVASREPRPPAAIQGNFR